MANVRRVVVLILIVALVMLSNSSSSYSYSDDQALMDLKERKMTIRRGYQYNQPRRKTEELMEVEATKLTRRRPPVTPPTPKANENLPGPDPPSHN